MSFIYNDAKRRLLVGALNLATADLRVALVMSNTTADTEDDANSFDDFTTVDEHDGASYARQALTGETVIEAPVSNTAIFDANDPTFATLGAGTRQCVGAIVYEHNGATPTDHLPVFYIDDGGFPFTATGSDFVMRWNAGGIMTAL